MRDQSTSTNPSASTTRAAIYIRVSSAPQEAHYGPDVQEQACRAYCAEHGISVVGVWHDTLPGTVIDRPGLDALLAAGRRGEADIIVFYKQDRLGRGEAFTIQKYRCKSAGLALHCPLEPLKDGLAGDVEHFARSLVSGEEARNIRLRTQGGRKARAEAGLLLPGSRPLYGYRWCEAGGRDKAAYRIDDDTAPVVRRIYRELVLGRPTRGIADALNRDGVPPPNGGRLWRRSTVRDVAKNPRYMGQGEGNRRRLERDPETGGMKRLAEELPGVPLAAGVIPPLVTPDDWHGVQARLAANKVAAIRNNRDPEAYLLRAGHVVCGQCGRAAMTYVKHLTGRDVPRYRVLKDRERHPRCANVQVDAQELDAAAWALVMRILAEPARLLDRLAQGDGDNPDEAELASIERALAGADRGVANLTDGIAQADDDATRGALVVALKAEAARRDALADRRDTLSARLAEAAGRRANLDDLRAWIEQTRAVLARGPWPVLTTERSSSGGRRLAIDLGQLSAEEEEQLKAWGDNPPCPPEGWVPDPDIAALLGLQLQHAKEQYERQPSYEERREAIRALGLVAILNAPGSDPPYTFRTTHDVGTVVTASTAERAGAADQPGTLRADRPTGPAAWRAPTRQRRQGDGRRPARPPDDPRDQLCRVHAGGALRLRARGGRREARPVPGRREEPGRDHARRRPGHHVHHHGRFRVRLRRPALPRRLARGHRRRGAQGLHRADRRCRRQPPRRLRPRRGGGDGAGDLAGEPGAHRVAADTLDEAIATINASDYGNMACIFTTSGAVARQFRYEARAGNIGINIGVAAPMAFFPFSGWGDSFFGDLHAQGRHGVEFYTETKVVVERWPREWSRRF